MVARTQLAAIDHNIWRDQKTDNQNFTEHFQKSRGDGLRKDFMKKRLYIQIRFDGHGLRAKRTKSDITTMHQEKKKTLPKNIAKRPAPPTSELVEAHISRFKIN